MENIWEVVKLKLYVCDYQIPKSEDLDFIIVEAEDVKSAESLVLEELKALNIPKRYIVNLEEVL